MVDIATRSEMPLYLGPVSWKAVQYPSMSDGTVSAQGQTTKPESPVGTPGNLAAYGIQDVVLDQMERSLYNQALSSWRKSGKKFDKWMETNEAQDLLKARNQVRIQRSQQEMQKGIMKANKEYADKYLEQVQPYFGQYIQGERPGDVELVQPGEPGYDPNRPKLKTLGDVVQNEWQTAGFTNVGGINIPQSITRRQVYDLNQGGIPLYQKKLDEMFNKEKLGSTTVGGKGEGVLGTQYAGIGLLQNDESTTETNYSQIQSAISAVRDKMSDIELRSAYQDFYEKGLGLSPIEVEMKDKNGKTIKKTLETREEQFNWFLERKARAAATGKDVYNRKLSFEYVKLPGFGEGNGTGGNKNAFTWWDQVNMGTNGARYKPYSRTGLMDIPINTSENGVPAVGRQTSDGKMVYDIDSTGAYTGNSKVIRDIWYAGKPTAESAYIQSGAALNKVPRNVFYSEWLGDMIQRIPSLAKRVGDEIVQKNISGTTTSAQTYGGSIDIARPGSYEMKNPIYAAIGPEKIGQYAYSLNIADIPGNPYNVAANKQINNYWVGTNLKNGRQLVISGDKTTNFDSNDDAIIVYADQIASGVPFPDNSGTEKWVHVAILTTQKAADKLELMEQQYNKTTNKLEWKNTTLGESDIDYGSFKLNDDYKKELIAKFKKDNKSEGKLKIVYGWISGFDIGEQADLERGFKYTVGEQMENYNKTSDKLNTDPTQYE